jgi:chromate transporter
VLKYAEIAVLQNVLAGLSASAAGLLIGTGLRLLTPHRSRRTALLFAGLAFAGMVFTRLPLTMVLLALAPISIAAAGLESARAR